MLIAGLSEPSFALGVLGVSILEFMSFLHIRKWILSFSTLLLIDLQTEMIFIRQICTLTLINVESISVYIKFMENTHFENLHGFKNFASK